MTQTNRKESERQNSTARSRIQYHLAALLTVLVIVSIVYFDTFRSMTGVYLNSDTFLHGFIILPICLYLVWRKWPQVESIAPRLYVPGIFLILVMSAAWFIADVLGIQVGKHLAVTAIVPAAVLTIMGVSFARSIAFPLAYLFFAVPFGEFWVPALQEITADFAIGLLRLTGVPVFRDGLYLSIPAGNFVVAEACSGIRYILATLALGTLYAYLSYQKTYKRLIFIAFSLVLPIVANGVRAYGIIAIAYYSDMKHAVGIDHLIYGWIFFGVVIGLMFLVGNRYRDDDPADHGFRPDDRQDFGGTPPLRSLAFSVLAAAIAMTAGPLASQALSIKQARQTDLLNGLPEAVAGWKGELLSEPQWRPTFIGATQETLARYSGPEAHVDVALVRYSGQQQGHELANNLNSIPGDDGGRQGNTREITVPLANGDSVQLFETSATRHGIIRRFWYWYEVDGKVVSGSLQIKLAEAHSLILGKPAISSIVVISVVDGDRWHDALDAFFQDAFGALSTCLRTTVYESNCQLGSLPASSQSDREKL